MNVAAHPPKDPRPALADADPPNELPQDDEDFAVYVATQAMWAETWPAGDLEFGPDDTAVEWLGGYGPGGAHTAAEWLLLGERMAADWAEAFDAMHAPVRQAA